VASHCPTRSTQRCALPAEALAFALLAALLHATWNLLLSRSSDTNAALAVAMVFGAAVAFPFALLGWRLEPEAVPFVIASSVLELGYFALLAAAYRRADLSLVYPISRGLAPVLVLVGGALVLGETATPVRVLGIVLVAIGIVLVRGLRSPASLANVLLACAIAVFIAGYTLVDRQGVRYADPITYLAVIVGIPGLLYLAVVGLMGGVSRVRAATTPRILVGGVAVVAAYGLVLAALRIAPAASVAAVRETSVVMATALAALVLGERVEPARWLGSIVVVVGIAMVVLG
jgi:drug/metabolite transporter (DMT)-like permease